LQFFEGEFFISNFFIRQKNSSESMRFLIGKELQKKFYLNLLASFIFGFAVFLFICGFYNIIQTSNVYLRTSYIVLIFTIFFIFFSVFLENRGVKIPHLFIGSSILTSIATLMTVCIVNGVYWIMNESNLPSEDIIIIGISVSTLIAFIIIKVIGSIGRGAS